MSTLKQIEANRLNAAKSTGPRTEAGKSAVRLNALKHGLFAVDPIIPGEDPAGFEALRTGHYERFQPAAPEEHVLLDAMVRHAWSLERSSYCETSMWNEAFELQRNHAEARAGESHIGNRLVLLQRRIDSAQRNYRRNLELLIKLQAARVKAAPARENTAAPIPQIKSPEPVNRKNGFVPSNPLSPAAAHSKPAPREATIPILAYKSRPEPPLEAA
jgi:hypothetical protein